MTVDYDGEQAAPPPASAVIAGFLRRSFSIADIFKRAIRGWLFGAIGLVLGLVFGIYSVWITPASYEVTIGLLPVDSTGSDIAIGGDTGGALGALAGLIGIGGGPVPKFTRFVASLYSSGVAKIMDRDYDMVCRTYSSSCDVKTHTWRKSTGFDAWMARMRASIAHLPDPDSPRTARDLAAFTESSITLSSDRTTHVLTLTMESRDPKFAVLFLQNLVQSTNDYIRQEDRGNIQPYVDYINRKLTTNLNLTQHDALSSLLLEQERRLMLTSVNVPYAASIQDGPNVNTSNSALRMLAVDGFLGLILGLGLGVFRSMRGRSSPPRSQPWNQY